MAEQDEHLRELVAEVAAAYFSNSHVSPADIPNVIQQIASSLGGVQAPSGAEAGHDGPADAAPATRLTAGQIRKSITPDALISFEDNKPYKTMKRHLSGRGLTPQQYREKWGLGADYPMVAPAYSAARSAMARSIGLGRKVGVKVPAKKTGGRKPAGT